MERGDCPDDSTFAERIEHALDADRLGAVEAHLDGCADCRRHLSDLARSSMGGATRPSAADLTAAEQGAEQGIDRGIGSTAAVDPPRVLDAARDAAVVAAASLPGFDACADVAALAQRAPSQAGQRASRRDSEIDFAMPAHERGSDA